MNYDGEMFIIEEVKLFKTPGPIEILKFSNVTVIQSFLVAKFMALNDCLTYYSITVSYILQYHCHGCVFVCDGSNMYRVSSMQAQTTE